MRIDFCLPVHNEEKILAKNALKLFEFLKSQSFNFDWEITIILNGCHDASKTIAKELNQKCPEINFLELTEAGKGNAIKQGFEKSRADILVYMDIDLAVALEDISKLIQPILDNQANLTFGSRMAAESNTNRSFLRGLSSKIYIFISKIILNHQFSDLQCGFKAITKQSFEKVLPNIRDNHWFFDTELIIFAKKENFEIKEIPVNWEENRYDERKSKIKVLSDGWIFFKKLIGLQLRLISGNSKKELAKIIFWKKTTDIRIQFFRFLFVGAASTLADMAVFYFFNTRLGYHYLIAQSFGFGAGVIVNYILSAFWVFPSNREKRKQEFVLFLIFAFSGLLISYLAIWFYIDILQITFFDNMIAKAMTSATAMFWNFYARKKFVFKID